MPALLVAVATGELPHQRPVVAGQELLRDALVQEEELVPEPLPLLDGRVAVRVRMADREHDEPVDQLRREAGHHPRERGAVVVPDDVRALDSEPAEDDPNVAEAAHDPVVLDRRGTIGLAVAAQVGREDAEPRLDQRGYLLPPHVRGVREAVQQEHRRPVALVEERQLDPVPCDAPHAVSLRPGTGLRGLGSRVPDG